MKNIKTFKQFMEDHYVARNETHDINNMVSLRYWLLSLSIQELIDYADLYGQEIYSQANKEQ